MAKKKQTKESKKLDVLLIDTDQEFKSFSISAEGKVKVVFMDNIITPPIAGREDSDIENNKHGIETKRKPHKDLYNALKRLTPFAMELIEMEVSDETMKDYTVSGIKLSGNLTLKKSRVELTILKRVNWTDGTTTIGTGQHAMYGESEYPRMAELATQVEKTIKEIELFVSGKCSDDNPAQYPLFERKMLVGND